MSGSLHFSRLEGMLRDCKCRVGTPEDKDDRCAFHGTKYRPVAVPGRRPVGGVCIRVMGRVMRDRTGGSRSAR